MSEPTCWYCGQSREHHPRCEYWEFMEKEAKAQAECANRRIMGKGHYYDGEIIGHIAQPMPRPEPEEWEKALEMVADHIRELKSAKSQLGEIRATLLVNFGEVERNTYGFAVKDEGSTLNLMIQVLDHLLKNPEGDGEAEHDPYDDLVASGGLGHECSDVWPKQCLKCSWDGDKLYSLCAECSLRDEVLTGVKQADRGELKDGDEVFGELRKKLEGKE